MTIGQTETLNQCLRSEVEQELGKSRPEDVEHLFGVVRECEEWIACWDLLPLTIVMENPSHASLFFVGSPEACLLLSANQVLDLWYPFELAAGLQTHP